MILGAFVLQVDQAKIAAPLIQRLVLHRIHVEIMQYAELQTTMVKIERYSFTFGVLYKLNLNIF
jgi:hypothetical protein